MEKNDRYSCAEYREEMILLALQRRLRDHNLSEMERLAIIKDIEKLEIKINIK